MAQLLSTKVQPVTASASSSSSTALITKKRAPSSARRAKALRLAPLTARDVEVDIGKRSVRDPYDANAFVTAAVNRRVDVLAAEHAAGRITEAQFLVGRSLQLVWERQAGVRGGSTFDSTTGGASNLSILAMGELTVEDLRMIGKLEVAKIVAAYNARAAQVIGEAGVRFLRAILAEGYTFGSYAEARGRNGERAGTDIAKRFRWLLEALTEAQHTARAPGALPIHDRYAEEARRVSGRLAPDQAEA